jgi:hypothetical protein
MPEQEERQLREEKKALVLAEIEKDPSNFWSWHALSCLFASNDDVTGAIEVCKGWIVSPKTFYCRLAIQMELTSLLAFQGNYQEALKYSRMLTHMGPVGFLQALSPPSPQIRSTIPNLSMEMSFERYIPKTLVANYSASNRI